MIRYGSAASAMRPMVSDDLLISRLKLLMIMAKAYLKGYPLGDFRKNAIIQNARHIFYAALIRTNCGNPPFAGKLPPGEHSQIMKPLDHFFLQRAQLLAIMLNAAIMGKSRGNYRNRAMAENIDHLCEYLTDRFQISDAKFLKVA